jgi:ectoine hydroxylase-related dioxygenase (phytanoyl-CoA dioxygenase family)
MGASRQAMHITEEDRSTYERDGVVCIRGAFSSAWLSFVSDAVEEAIASPGPHAQEFGTSNGSGRFFGDIEVSMRLPRFRRFALESPAGEIAGRIMGASRVNFFYDQLLVKEPGASERTPWHQDQPYWAISGYQVCSVWLPLDPISEEISVEYVCGSHRWPEFNPYHN